MGLERKKCKNCKTTYYGNDKEGMDDGYCFMCSTMRKFIKAFGLDDLGINEVDINRVRNPQWMNGNTEDPKDWKNYIPFDIKEMWYNIPVESRLLAIMFAEREARAIDILSDVIAKEAKK